jgi:hypothetical protein
MAPMVFTPCALAAAHSQQFALNIAKFVLDLAFAFFALAIGFSLSNSIARSSGYSERKVAGTVHAN